MAALLRGVPLLSPLLDEEIDLLSRFVEPVEVGAGAVLVAEGTATDRVYLVVEGCAAVTLGGAPLSTVGRGELIGALGVVASVARSTSVVAQTPMRLGRFDVWRLWQLLDRPSVADRLTARPPATSAPQPARNRTPTSHSYVPSVTADRRDA